jgi:hypothetical protein
MTSAKITYLTSPRTEISSTQNQMSLVASLKYTSHKFGTHRLGDKIIGHIRKISFSADFNKGIHDRTYKTPFPKGRHLCHGLLVCNILYSVTRFLVSCSWQKVGIYFPQKPRLPMYKITRCHNPDGHNARRHYREILKPSRKLC